MFAFLEQFVNRGCSPFHPDFPVFSSMVVPLPSMGQANNIEGRTYQPESNWLSIDVNEICQAERRTTASFISQCIHNTTELLNPNVPVQQLEILLSQEDDRKMFTIVEQANRWFTWLPLPTQQPPSFMRKRIERSKRKMVNRFRNHVLASKGRIPEPRIDAAYKRLSKHADETLIALTREAIKTTEFWMTTNKPIGYLESQRIIFETDVDVLWVLSSSSSLHLINGWTSADRKKAMSVRWTLTEQYGATQHGRRKKIEMLGDFIRQYIANLKKDEIITVTVLNQRFNSSKRKVYKPTRRQWLLALRNVTSLDRSLKTGPLLYIE